jgi:hypothetical protein
MWARHCDECGGWHLEEPPAGPAVNGPFLKGSKVSARWATHVLARTALRPGLRQRGASAGSGGGGQTT